MTKVKFQIKSKAQMSKIRVTPNCYQFVPPAQAGAQ